MVAPYEVLSFVYLVTPSTACNTSDILPVYDDVIRQTVKVILKVILKVNRSDVIRK